MAKPVHVRKILESAVGSGRREERTVLELHASDLVSPSRKFCPREVVIQSALKEEKPRYMNTPLPLRYTFALGKAIESLVINTYLREHVVGDWQCLCKTSQRFVSYPGRCARCGIEPEYTEPRFIDVTGVSCGIDCFVKPAKGRKFLPVELKTESEKSYVERRRADPYHIARTNLYLAVIRRCGDIQGDPRVKYINTERASVMYLLKGYGKKSAEGYQTFIKEYHLQRDLEEAKPYLQLAARVKVAQRDKLMPSGICPNQTCSRAKMCGVARECFSGKYPAGRIYHDQ